MTNGEKVALFDPAGLSANVLDGLGVRYAKVSSPTEVAAMKNLSLLVIGKGAAGGFPLSDVQDVFDKGLNILVLPQEAETWQALGLRPMDTGSRQLFLRDRSNAAYAEVTDDMLAYWRGAPAYGRKDYGPLMSHTAQRGPRWKRNHIVAALTLEIPAAVGYRSVIDGAFDMNYAGVLTFSAGAGKITYCTLDFEGRIGVDPAATQVARAVFADALRPQETFRQGVLISNDAERARKCGFTVSEPEPVFRVTPPTTETFRGIGPSLWRWTDRIEACRLSNPPEGFTVSADGLVAEGERKGRHVVFLMVPQGQLTNRYHNVEAAKQCGEAYKAYVKNVSQELLAALGMLPAGTKGTHRRDVLEKGRGTRNEWYDMPARELVGGCGLAQGLAKKGIRVLGGRRIWTSGCGAVTWNDAYAREIESGDNLLLVDPNDDICAALGFRTAFRCVKEIPEARIGSVRLPTCDLRGVEGATVRVLTAVPSGFELSPGGFYAYGRIGKAEVYVAMLDPHGFQTAAAAYARCARSAAYAEEHVSRLYARVRTNLGAQPTRAAARRALYQQGAATYATLPAAYVIGPFAQGADNAGGLMKAWHERGEKMAIEGDFDPNVNFPVASGGAHNWRTTLAPDAKGCYDLSTIGSAFAKAAFPGAYAIVHVERKRAGAAMLRFGVDRRARVWCNGQEAFACLIGADYPKCEVKLDLKAGDNVLAFKIGGGAASGRFWALLEAERSGAVRPKADDVELDSVKLYPDLVSPAFDPYEFTYW